MQRSKAHPTVNDEIRTTLPTVDQLNRDYEMSFKVIKDALKNSMGKPNKELSQIITENGQKILITTEQYLVRLIVDGAMTQSDPVYFSTQTSIPKLREFFKESDSKKFWTKASGPCLRSKDIPRFLADSGATARIIKTKSATNAAQNLHRDLKRGQVVPSVPIIKADMLGRDGVKYNGPNIVPSELPACYLKHRKAKPANDSGTVTSSSDRDRDRATSSSFDGPPDASAARYIAVLLKPNVDETDVTKKLFNLSFHDADSAGTAI